ncbi:hypothetical protein FN846DRAFT_315662 [Sphaerosporella brunnea]|uniref:Uncharacterized protein n=1 Tax=Sphaerosporella brunnea TaxID=1250544 RepID=A0A5J5EKT4_9PEZI|nr:hypothetical protein FN846DRAFT_315662 [Sphaerosporella brunnea]
MDMKPWKEVVKTIYPDPDEHTVIIDDGVPHCEAVLACLHYLASSGESIDPSVVSQDVLDQLKKAAPLIAPSKRCCPVCAAIQHELSSGRPGKYPIYNKHVYIYGCALPPGLPGVVRERVIRKFEDLLREYLDDVKLRSLSHCSAESVALSPTERLHTFTFRETPMF